MKVIIAVDESPYSKEVVKAVTQRSWPEHTQFKVLTVLEPLCVCPEDFASSIMTPTMSQIQKHRMESAQHLCESIRQQIQESIENAIVHCEVRDGLARREIVDTAVDWKADKIMIGAHGKGVCPHNLPGSVSRAVAGHAPCSVEIVRSKSTRKAIQPAIA